MGKRIFIIDPKDPKTPLTGLYGRGIDSSQIFTIDGLEYMPQNQKEEILKLGDGDGVMLIGGEPFKYLRDVGGYHYGIRNENYLDCSYLYRLSMTGGAYAKCVFELPSQQDIDEFFSPHFTDHVKIEPIQKVLKTYEDCSNFMTWLENLPKDEYFGFDYEASGMPLDKWFELSGASICNSQYAGFLSFTDLRKNAIPDQYRDILRRLGNWLEKRQDHVVVFNMQYEYQVSRRMLGVNLYNLVDAQVINVLDSYHRDKKYSLKWTAQRVLGVQVWDQHFDRLSDLLEEMYFEVKGKTKKDQVKVYKVTKENFHLSPEFREIINMFPQYEEEFKELILTYWGNPFMCISSDILGYYCNLDAFYTLQMFLKKKPEYSEDCWNVYLDNARFGSKLMSGGMYINEDFRLYYANQCEKMMAWGITYCASARCYINMQKYIRREKDLKKYPTYVARLVTKNKIGDGTPIGIAKTLLTDYVDYLDTSDIGINEGALMMDWGEEFATKFIELLKETMTEIKFKGKIDENVGRKKKLLAGFSEKLASWINLDKVDLTSKAHQELLILSYYQQAYRELQKISSRQLYDINNIPEKIKAFGQVMELREYSDFISNNYFKCKSPQENESIISEMTATFPAQTSWIAALSESIEQLPGGKDFYKNLGLETPSEGFNHFMREWENYCNDPQNYIGSYPEKMYTEALHFYQKGIEAGDAVKETWTDFKGFNTQKGFFPEVASTESCLSYEIPFQESDTQDDFFFMRKLTLNYLTYKKYAKVLSTYIEGMFKAKNKWVIEDEDHIPLREADPDEPRAVEKCFIHYEINTKASGRTSSAIHTAISHSDLKDCITTPPIWDEEGNQIYGGGPFLLSYYDISSAEVKAAGFASMDPNLVDCFNRGEDIYIKTAKLYYKDFDKKSKGDQKKARKQFKTIFLGLLYGLGMKSLAQRLNCSEEEAKNIIDAVYSAYPKLREYIATQQQYPFTHNGHVNTFFGNKLKLVEWDWLMKAESTGEQRSLQAKIQRLGVNYPIQGGTSSAMASGFFNTYRETIKQHWARPLEPYICVHDSSTSAFPVSKVFEIRKFYDTYFTDYCAGIGPKIKLLFDLLEGNSYESASEVKQIDPETIEFSANAHTLLPIYDKIMREPEFQGKVTCSVTRDTLIPNYIQSPMERFIIAEGTCVVLDKSKYTITFTKTA